MTTHEKKRSTRRTSGSKRKATAALVFVALILAGYHFSWVAAQARAAVVLFSVLRTPVLGDATRLLTSEPEVTDTDVGGSPAYMYAPGGDVAGAHPAIVFINGTTPEGRELPAVRSLAEGLARSGFVVFVPDLVGLREDEISPDTVSAAKAAVRAAADHPKTKGREVSIVGASTGATLALLVAKDPMLGDRVSSVSGLAPFADIRNALSLATTESYPDGKGRTVLYKPDPFLSYAITRSLLATLPPGEDRDTLAAELSRVDRHAPDPLSGLRRRPTDDLGPEATAAVRLLANEDPSRVNALYRALPRNMRSDLEALSPLADGGHIEAPVELATAPRDKYFPPSESFAAARLSPDSRVTVTGALEHAEPGFEPRNLGAFVELDAFIVRALHEAASSGTHAEGRVPEQP